MGHGSEFPDLKHLTLLGVPIGESHSPLPYFVTGMGVDEFRECSRAIAFENRVELVCGSMSVDAKIMEVTKQVEFAAAHRLYREDWSEERNRDAFGACANPYGHGHNYLLEVTVAGPVDPETGMVVHFATLKRLLQECVVQPLDHRHLNHDVPMLAGKLPTSENLVACLWDQLSRATGGQSWKLVKLRLGSTARNWVEYRG